MSDEAPPKDEQVVGDSGTADEDVPPPGQGVASSKSSLSEAEALLSDMMKRQATVRAPSGGADILAASRQLGKDGNDNDSEGKKKHAFWETQPMKVNESDQSGGSKKAAKNSKSGSTAAADEVAGALGDGDTMQHCPIVPNKPREELRQEPYNMPKGFEWSAIDILDETQRNEVYDLLTRNYVEDDDAQFRFDYSPPVLALGPYPARIHQGLSSRRPVQQEWEAHGLHHRRPRRRSSVR